MYKAFCVFLSFFYSIFSFFGLEARSRKLADTEVAAQVEYKNGVTGEITLTFEKRPVNTVELTFDGEAESEVIIKAGANVVYVRTGAESYRFCAFKTVVTDSITVSVSGGAALKNVTVSHKTSSDRDFRITAYLADASGTDISRLIPESFDVVTDVIVIGNASYDINGQLSLKRDVIEKTLENLRTVIGDRDVKIHLNMGGPGADGGISDWNEQMNNLSEKNSKAFKTDCLADNIVAVLDEYDFDGFFLDYEYPLEAKYWRDIGNFFKKLDKKTDKLLGLAVADWNMSVINANVIRHTDMFEFMQYDMFDSYGNHSSFSTAVSCFNAAEDMLIPREKVDVGVPFYARPADHGAFWPSYRDYAAQLGTRDYADTPYGRSYFNCAQTVYDKTAYALDKELGGMMVWHYACDVAEFDSELSLFGAMKACLEDRTV